MRYVKLPVFATFITLFLMTALAAQAEVPKGSRFVIKELVRGSNIHGANGLAFDAQGRLYIASQLGREIIVMDSRTGKILERTGPDSAIQTPDDLAFGPDGSLYWTNVYTGHVGRRGPDGIVTTQFVNFGVNPITFSDDGRLFVGLDFLGDGLYELDPELEDAPRPIIVASEQNPYPLGFLNGFDFGPDGRLYGPIWTAGIIVSLDVDSCENSSQPWLDCDLRLVASGFSEPAAVKFGPRDDLHVVDQTGGVFIVDASTGEATPIAFLAPQQDNLAFNADGSLFVSNFGDGSIRKVLPGGKSRLLNIAGMTMPGGVAVLPSRRGESVFVADFANLREFDGRTGTGLSAEMASVTSFTGLYIPFAVSAFDDSLIVSATGRGAVQVWNPETKAVTEQYQMVFPVNAIRFRDGLAVADPALGGVVWADSLNIILGAPYIFFPSGLASDEDSLWVTDWLTGSVWQLDFVDGIPLTPMMVASGLSSPEGLAVDLDGTLLVVETGAGRVSRIDLNTSEVTVVADSLALGMPGIIGFAPTWAFNGVAVGPSGAIYVTGDTANVIYRIWPR